MKNRAFIERFRDGKAYGHTARRSLLIEGNILYSYGRHFPLAIRHDFGAGIEYVINGDRYSVTTASHQSAAINLLTPNVQIPFSALHAAGIYIVEKIEILAYRPDDWHQICTTCNRETRWTGEKDEHTADGSPVCPREDTNPDTRTEHVLGAVLFRHRGKYYLSGTDDQEHWRRRAYFLSQLRSRPHELTVDAAFADLAPKEVRAARAIGIEVRRQGDIFAIATDAKTVDLPGPSEKRSQLLGTSHYVTETRKIGKITYARGVLTHRPERRRPQHARVTLPGWYRIVRNTAKESWNAVGSID